MFFKQYPKAIPYLFMTEMWERFSYYGITAILILYMSKTFAMTQEQIYAIYGAYGALVYMTPLIGGRIADNYLGSYHTVIIGSLLIALGHFIVAIPSDSLLFFYYGLTIIIIGTGLFMPNINAIVGHLYDEQDQRRENGFTLAYMGRNIGTILAPIIAAEIAAVYDWRWAFIIAGIGMLIGLSIFLLGKKHYQQRSFYQPASIKVYAVLLFSLLVLSLLVYFFMAHHSYVGAILVLTVIIMTSFIIYLAKSRYAARKNQIFLAMILTGFYIVFLILLQQSGGALNLFTDTFVNRQFFGFTIETGIFQSVEPLALVMLTPLYSLMWSKLAKQKIILSDPAKFTWGISLMSASFVLMAIAMNFTDPHYQINFNWITVTYVFQAAGELFIGPIGLAMVSRLIPDKMLGLYMGYWVLATAIANFIAAKIGAYITPAITTTADASTDALAIAIGAYQAAFYQLSIMGFLCAFLLLLMKKRLAKLAN